MTKALNQNLRLKMMIHMLENHDKYFPRTTFNLDSWYVGESTQSCGTAACAVGSAMFWEPLRAQGLSVCPRGTSPEYLGSTSWNAVIAFFGLTYEQAQYLFSSDSYRQRYPTAKQVANRIKKFLKETGRA